MALGALGGALGGMMKKPAQAMVGGKPQPRPGIGPTQALGGLAGKMQKPMQPGMQNAVQNAGNAIGQAFGGARMQQPQPAPVNWGQSIPMPQRFSGAPQPMMGQGGGLQTPEPSAPASPDMQNTPEMMQAKQNQMAQMAQTFGNQLGGMFGGGMARPQAMMGQAAPDESMDAMRRNKFQQIRPGIGPRFGMRPQQPMQQMQQQEPEMY